jgi:hypothetical protein
VPAESPGERELLERVVREDPEARAARRAHERWVTSQRLWAAIDGAGITDDGDRARFIAALSRVLATMASIHGAGMSGQRRAAFIAARLWPDMPAPWMDAIVARTRERAAGGHRLRRPSCVEDVVGPRLAGLMRARGYPTRAG